MRSTLSEILFGRRLPEYPEAPVGGMLVTEHFVTANPRRWEDLLKNHRVAFHDKPHMIYGLAPIGETP